MINSSAPSPISDLPNLDRFPCALPSLINKRALLRRWDQKYLLSRQQFIALIPELYDDYFILWAGKSQVEQYRTLYFDTPDLRCFTDHHRGRRARYKVRIRHYLNRRVSFLEVKKKTASELTKKKRTARPFGDSILTSVDLEFLRQHYPVSPEALKPAVWTNFTRLTLLSRTKGERVTIDWRIAFKVNQDHRSIHKTVILETKQAPISHHTPVIRSLRSRGIRPLSLSKYCVGTTLLVPSVRANRFLPKLREIERLEK